VSFEGDDFGFCGPAYEAPNTNQDAQRLINWMIEIDRSTGAKEPVGLLGTPGLKSLIQVVSPQGANFRGFWVLPGNTQALAVVGNSVVLLTITVPATQTSIAQF